MPAESKPFLRVSEAYSLVPLGWLRNTLGFSPSGLHRYLEALGVPILDLAEYRGHSASDDDRYVNSAAYEIALLQATFPKQDGWKKLTTDPKAVTGLMALLALVYGIPEREQMRDRLLELGEDLLKGALRDPGDTGYKPPAGPKPESLRIKSWRHRKAQKELDAAAKVE